MSLYPPTQSEIAKRLCDVAELAIAAAGETHLDCSTDDLLHTARCALVDAANVLWYLDHPKEETADDE